MLNSSCHLDSREEANLTETRGEWIWVQRLSVSEWSSNGRGVMEKVTMPSLEPLGSVGELSLWICGRTDLEVEGSFCGSQEALQPCEPGAGFPVQLPEALCHKGEEGHPYSPLSMGTLPPFSM